MSAARPPWPALVREARASVALDGETHSVDDGCPGEHRWCACYDDGPPLPDGRCQTCLLPRRPPGAK